MEWFRFWPPGGVVAQSVQTTFWPKRYFAVGATLQELLPNLEGGCVDRRIAHSL